MASEPETLLFLAGHIHSLWPVGCREPLVGTVRDHASGDARGHDVQSLSECFADRPSPIGSVGARLTSQSLPFGVRDTLRVKVSRDRLEQLWDVHAHSSMAPCQGD
jgi:hypothetical protein